MSFEIWYGVLNFDPFHDILKDFVILVAFSILLLLLRMSLTSQLKVDSLGVRGEECLLEEVDELLLCDRLKDLELLFLAVKLVLMCAQFTPMSRILLAKVDILLRKFDQDGLLLDFKVLI